MNMGDRPHFGQCSRGFKLSHLENFNAQFSGNEQGEKLVFLHGLLGSAANWRRIIPSFETDFHVMALDQRGHGRSFQPKSGYSPEDYANDLKAILDELKWDKIYLVGHSMGGRNALNFAFRFPERVQKLVIEDIGPDGNKGGSIRVQQLLDSIPTPFAKKEQARDFFRNEFKDFILGQYLYSNITEQKDGTFSWRFSRQGAIDSLNEGRAIERWNEVEGLKVPTLVVRGENSTDLPRDIYQRMLKANPLITGVEIKEAGHWVHFDRPDDFISELKRFF
jgi:pimeloyl-ACP methyl ester carboxylesterase